MNRRTLLTRFAAIAAAVVVALSLVDSAHRQVAESYLAQDPDGVELLSQIHWESARRMGVD